MAFSDPQSVTYDAVAKSLPRISSGLQSGAFKDSTGEFTLQVNHTTTKQRIRHVARFDMQNVAPSVLVPDVNLQQSISAYLTINAPVTGSTVITAADKVLVAKALTDWLVASSNANLIKLCGGEN